MSELPDETNPPTENSRGASDEIVYWVLEELKNGLDENKKGLDAVISAVEELQTASEDNSGQEKGPRPVGWSFKHVTGDQRQQLWAEVSDFVQWINTRYFPDKPHEAIASCWFEHGAVVEELTALWAAWHAALHDHKQPTSDYAAWHAHYFWPAMKRINNLLQDCRTAEHEPISTRAPRPYPGLEAFIDQDCRHHPDSQQVEENINLDIETGEIGPAGGASAR